MSLFCFFFPACARPLITDEQEAFIRQVLEVPFEQRKCGDLITLDTLHLYCGGLKSTAEAHRLDEFSRRCK